MFYEVMWRIWAERALYPVPWWVQQTFRRWSDAFDGGLFDSKEASLSSNALYRYWNMVGVKDHPQESVVDRAVRSSRSMTVTPSPSSSSSRTPGGCFCRSCSMPRAPRRPSSRASTAATCP
jgi:hypothetical protein